MIEVIKNLYKCTVRAWESPYSDCAFCCAEKEKSWGASFHMAIVAKGERTPAFFYKEKTGRLVHRVPITQVEHAPTLSLPAIGVTC